MTAESSVAIYVIGQGLNEDSVIKLALERLSANFGRVEVVIEADYVDRFKSEDDGALENVEFVAFEGAVHTPIAGYREALLRLFEKGPVPGPLLLTGSQVFGPLKTLAPGGYWLPEDADVLAPYWHGCKLDIRLTPFKPPECVLQLDCTFFSPALIADEAFQTFWKELKPTNDPWRDLLDGAVGLGKLLEEQNRVVAYPMSEDIAGSSEPKFFEIDKLVQHGCPCIPASVLMLDPLIHDLSAINLRGALDWLRGADPEVYKTLIRFATRYVKLRDFATIADQYEVLPTSAAHPDKDAWSFGAVAVFIHAFYAEMMPEFWELIQQLPCEAHLFITTATEDNAVSIREFLAEKGWPEGAGEVRVVEENRGRDMSSLFITWRDIALSGKYEVALRLHSKRTPQVARQVGESFKEHLFENLVQSPGYVRNVLDLMEEQPDLGLLIPPVIHVGFGTLGHAWYNNKTTLSALAKEMYIDVPLDDFTPVGAYGTMYWFRPDALFKMFDWRWKWTDYNPEPHHIDGGVAHVQERLIAYTVQDRGYRIMQIMTPRMAARNYGRLEYKTQMFAAYCASNNVMDQKMELESRGMTVRGVMYRQMREIYGSTLRRFPQSRGFLRPFKNVAVTLLMRRS